MANLIVLKGPQTLDEARCSEAIVPGELVEFNSGLLRKHATATGAAGAYFAVESTWGSGSNNPSGPAIDAAYASGDVVPFRKATPENEIYAFLEGAHAAVVKGALLESAGGGNLQAGTTNPIARSAEAHDGTNTARERIKVWPL